MQKCSYVETRFRNINHLLRKRFCEYPKPYFYYKYEIYATSMDFQFVTHLNCKNTEKKQKCERVSKVSNQIYNYNRY